MKCEPTLAPTRITISRLGANRQLIVHVLPTADRSGAVMPDRHCIVQIRVAWDSPPGDTGAFSGPLPLPARGMATQGDNDGKHRISGHLGAGAPKAPVVGKHPSGRFVPDEASRTDRSPANCGGSAYPSSERCAVGSRYFFAERCVVGSQLGNRPLPARAGPRGSTSPLFSCPVYGSATGRCTWR